MTCHWEAIWRLWVELFVRNCENIFNESWSAAKRSPSQWESARCPYTYEVSSALTQPLPYGGSALDCVPPAALCKANLLLINNWFSKALIVVFFFLHAVWDQRIHVLMNNIKSEVIYVDGCLHYIAKTDQLWCIFCPCRDPQHRIEICADFLISSPVLWDRLLMAFSVHWQTKAFVRFTESQP